MQPTRGPALQRPVVDQGPMTADPVKNLGLGLTGAAVTNYGTQWMAAGDTIPNAIALFLNTIVMQPLKKVFKPARHMEVAVVVMFVVAFAILYLVIFKEDVAKSFYDATLGTFQAIANYKADKASGLNILKPAED